MLNWSFPSRLAAEFLGLKGLVSLFGLLGLLIMVGVLSAAPAHAASPNNQAQQQLILAAPPQQVFAAATQAFEQWSRGEVVAQDPATMQVKGLSRTKFFKFVDDITVSIQPIPTDPSQTQVSIQSVGRMGEYDFGGNQRNITEYLGILKTALKLT